jgi:hypothetical protein
MGRRRVLKTRLVAAASDNSDSPPNPHPRLPKELQDLLRVLQDTARRVGKVAEESKVPNVDVAQYVESFRCVGGVMGVGVIDEGRGWRGLGNQKTGTNTSHPPPPPSPGRS